MRPWFHHTRLPSTLDFTATHSQLNYCSECESETTLTQQTQNKRKIQEQTLASPS
ncbi:hypothetical protein EVA_12171 [gut metagenome]|uniref:Uncharacterized protein n=1 Tax=gut metagenome TaxID=749906 RepID=J9FYS3_9ZZZZ